MAKKRSSRKHRFSSSSTTTPHGRSLGVPHAEAESFMSAYNSQRFEEALAVAQNMVQRFTNSAFAWKALGTTLLESGDAASAITPLLRAYELDASDALTLTSLAGAYYRVGDEQRAISYQTQAVDAQPEYAPAQYRLAEMLGESGAYNKALKYANKALEKGYDELHALSQIGLLQYKSKSFSEALKNYRFLVNKYPEYSVIYNNLGNILKDIGQYEEAEKNYRRALEIEPDMAMAYSNLYFAMHYNPSSSSEKIINFAKNWDANFALKRMPAVKNSKKNR